MDSDTINELELLSHNAWFAEERMRLGGWLLRADHGVTRRANSVLPLGDPGLDLATAIDFAIEFYQSRKLIPRFQMTDVSVPTELDDRLHEFGFKQVFPVELWTAEINKLTELTPSHETEYLDYITNEWTDTFLQASSHSPSTMNVRKKIMERTDQPHVFVQATSADSIDAVGYGVVEGEWLGIFNICTLPRQRNKGAATSVNSALGLWGSKLGSSKVYLQVEAKNDVAKQLYSKLGFTHAYTYWYRRLN